MTQYCQYQIRLRGDPDLVRHLGQFIPQSIRTLGEGRAYRRAVALIYRDAARVEIVRVKSGHPEVARL